MSQLRSFHNLIQVQVKLIYGHKRDNCAQTTETLVFHFLETAHFLPLSSSVAVALRKDQSKG